MADKINNNPWLGLSSYKYEDASRFYGRDKELQDLAEIIRQNSFTTIYGVSGAGKTSIINAGLFPVLDKEHYLPIYIRLNHGEGRLGYDEQIITAVDNALVKVCAESELMVDANIESDLDKLWLYFHSHRFWTSDNHKLIPILFIDQFEEIFTKNEDVNDVWSFFNVIDSLQYNMPTERILAKIQETDQCVTFGEEMNFRVVFSMREDFLPRLEDYCFDIPAMRRNRVGLKPLNGLQALEVITKPRPDVVSHEVALHIISKVVGQEIKDNHRKLESIYVETSILSLFCSELYNYLSTNATSQNITRSLVDTYGENILELYYNRNMQMLPEKTYIYLEGQLLTHSGFRNSVAFEDLIVNGVSQEQLEQLEENRIIRIEDVYHVRRVEFTHDVLCKIAKEHRNKRQSLKQSRRRIVDNSLWGIEVAAFSLVSLLFVINLFVSSDYTSYGYLVLPGIKATFITSCCILILFFDYSPLAKLCSNGWIKNVFLLLLVAVPFTVQDQINSRWFSYLGFTPSYKILTLLSFINFIYQTNKERLTLKLKNSCCVVLTIITILYNILLSPTVLIVLIPIISLFILSPFRLCRYKNYVYSSVVICISILTNAIIILLTLNIFNPQNAKIWILAFALYPILYLVYELKKKDKTSFKESLHYCFSFQIYEDRSFFRNFTKVLVWIMLFTSSIITGLSLNENITAVNTFVAGLCSYYLLKSLFNLSEKSLTVSKNKLKALEPIIVISYLLLIIVQQYIPYGVIMMCSVFLFSALFVHFQYKNALSSNFLIKHTQLFIMWIIPFVIIPMLSIGYNQFNLVEYARIYNGRIVGGHLRFIKIKDMSSNVGLRDRSNIVIPVKYKEIKYLYTDDYSYEYDNIIRNMVFSLTLNDGRKHRWNCCNHLDLNNICSESIISYYKKLSNMGNSSYLDYLLSNHHFNIEEIRQYATQLIKYHLEGEHPEYAIQGFFKNSNYLQYLSDDFLKKIFNELLPKRIKQLDVNYDKNRLLIECAYYQLLCKDVDGARNNIQKILKDIDEQNKISANRILCDIYIVTKDYDNAEKILKSYSSKEERFFASQGKNYYEKKHEHDGTIQFVDAVRNDIKKIKMWEACIDSNEGFKEYITPYLHPYSTLPDYDFAFKCYDGKYNTNGDYRMYIKCQEKSLYNDEIDYKYMYIMNGNKIVTPFFVRFSSSKDVDPEMLTIIEAKQFKRRFFNFAESKMIDGEYDKAWRFSEGYAIVVKNEQLFVIDKHGKKVSTKTIPYSVSDSYNYKMYGIEGFSYNQWEPNYIFKNGTCAIKFANDKMGLIDIYGNWVVSPSYNYISESIEDGFRIVEKDEKQGVIDVNGQLVINPTHNIFTNFPYVYKFDDIEFDSDNIQHNSIQFVNYIKKYVKEHPVQ